MFILITPRRETIAGLISAALEAKTTIFVDLGSFFLSFVEGIVRSLFPSVTVFKFSKNTAQAIPWVSFKITQWFSQVSPLSNSAGSLFS
jgi:hypothetical protein